jgi:hypothetical protein
MEAHELIDAIDPRTVVSEVTLDEVERILV